MKGASTDATRNAVAARSREGPGRPGDRRQAQVRSSDEESRDGTEQQCGTARVVTPLGHAIPRFPAVVCAWGQGHTAPTELPEAKGLHRL